MKNTASNYSKKPLIDFGYISLTELNTQHGKKLEKFLEKAIVLQDIPKEQEDLVSLRSNRDLFE